jgi:hypothetical protein
MPTPVFDMYSPGVNENTESKVKNLVNAYTENTQQLQWLLANLDEKNVMRAKAVIADWIYAGNIKATQIDVTEAKIQAAQIETLEVGTNVTMGAGATISWANVSGKDNVVDKSLGYTYLQSDKIYSPTIEGGTITGVSLTAKDYLYIEANSYNEGLIFNSGFTQMYVKVNDPSGTLEIGPYVNVTSGLTVNSSAVLTQSIADARYSLTTHNHGNSYIKAVSQDVSIQYFSDHIEVNGGGGWKVIYFA